MPRKRRQFQVALLIETSNAYARGLLRGVRDYVREHGRWSTYLVEQGRGNPPPNWVAGWHGDGIIARIENPTIAQAVRDSGLPVVDISAARLLPDVPWVETNDQAIAQAAVDHLTERGFKNFAFCGDDRFNWSNWRSAHFAHLLREAGHDCHVYRAHADDSTGPEQELESIGQWIRSLPKPIGIMACYDIRGRKVVDACRELDIRVPDDVAVIGVDNDELLCDLCDPSLSSIVPDSQGAGYVAASLLDKMLQGEKLGEEAHLVPPIDIATRQSTDVLAIDDAEISAAVRYIRDHACEGLRVDELLEHIPLSRRKLEARFKNLLGRTPYEEIFRLQMEQVKELLRETDLPLSMIAPRAGFRHAESLSAAFRKYAGLSPTSYRKRHRRSA